jgi:sulfate adenylyltransferase
VLDDISEPRHVGRADPPTRPGAPVLQPSDALLADVQLTLDGVRVPVPVLGAGFADWSERDLPAGGRVRLSVPHELATTADAAGVLIVTDTESTPLAVLEDVSTPAPGLVEGVLRATGRSETGAFGSRRPAPMPRTAPARLVVVAARPLGSLDLAAIDTFARRLSADVLVVVPTAGQSPDNVPPEVLLRTVDDAFDGPRAPVVGAVPLRWRSPALTEALAIAVAAAYDGTHVWLARAAGQQSTAGGGGGDGAIQVLEGTEAADRQWSTLLGALQAGTARTDDPVLASALPALLRWRPPRSRRGLVVFFTGLSGSGKSTLARGLAGHVTEHADRSVTLLDGDVVRRMLSAGLGFDRAGRDLNVRRIGFVAAEIARHGGIAVCAPIAPYAESRAAVRRMVEQVGDLVLVHVTTPLEECERRDLKGLYAKARAGSIEQFTGISDDYDEPLDADLRIDTSVLSPGEALATVVDHLVTGGWLRSTRG